MEDPHECDLSGLLTLKEEAPTDRRSLVIMEYQGKSWQILSKGPCSLLLRNTES